jgi:transcription elongation factor Elf1
MRYRLDFSGECRHCGAAMNGVVHGVPRQAERLVLFHCAACDQATGWAPVPAGRRRQSGAVNQAYLAATPPDRCPNCQGRETSEHASSALSFQEWRSLEMAWDLVDRGERSFAATAPCWDCGRPVEIAWEIEPRSLFSIERRMTCLFWTVVLLSPLLLLLSPLIILIWAGWLWLSGGCLRCGHPLAAYSSLPLKAEDGGGSLHQCPRCGAFYYLSIMGPVAARRLTPVEVRNQWPELDETKLSNTR